MLMYRPKPLFSLTVGLLLVAGACSSSESPPVEPQMEKPKENPVEVLHAIAGRIAGDTEGGITVTLSGDAVLTTSTDRAGRYRFDDVKDGDYVVTPTAEGYRFTNEREPLTVDGADRTGIDFQSSVATPELANPLVYEAEDFTSSDRVNVSTNGSWYSGPGYVTFQREQAWLEWDNIEVPATGFYEFRFHYAYNRPYVPPSEILINGRPAITVEEFVSTGGWEDTGVLQLVARLNAGANTVRVRLEHFAPSSPNLDYLEVDAIGDAKRALTEALVAVDRHIQGEQSLTAAEFASHKATIDASVGVLAEGDRDLITLAFELVQHYESTYGPLFLNDATRIGGSGWDRRLFVPDVDTTTLSVMQAIVDHVYQWRSNIKNLRSLIDGFMFESSEHFPGRVTSMPDPAEVHSVQVDCEYPDVYGRTIAFEEDPARKPTGVYLAPGSIATVRVPEAIVGKGYQIRVGAHAQNHKTRPFVRRLDRVSVVYDLDETEIEVANPFGGGVYVEVPYLADEGVQRLEFVNVVRSPFFSLQPHNTTSLTEWQNEERSFGAPWADFQTEKFMIQVPTSWIYNVDDPKAVLEAWDTSMDAVSDLMGFPRVRGKELLYLQVDVMIKGPAYSIGYPQINQTYSAYDAFDRHGGRHPQFTMGPLHGVAEVEHHELGHAVGMQKFPGENESVVNLLYAASLHRKFGEDLDSAFRKSLSERNGYRTLATTAITWMTSENFRLQNSMTKLEMQYQLKGHARYIEIARLFGWEILDNYWRSIIDDEESGATIDRTVDGLILRLSKSAGVDLTPLIQFWGVQPDDPVRLGAAVASAGLEPSTAIFDTLMAYKASIPEDNTAFQLHARSWWGEEPIARPNHTTLSDHDALFETYDEAYAAQLHAIMQANIDAYFPNGRPGGGSGVKVFILAGQSNMHGHGEISEARNPNIRQELGTLLYAVTDDPDSQFYQFLVDGAGEWIVRDDVFIRTHDRGERVRSGGLTIGFGTDFQKSIGPELGFGHRMGDLFSEPVLLIKVAWGGKSLGEDFRPPSATGETGPYFTRVVSTVREVLDDIGTYVPNYNDRGYELAGFVWHQGWNDRVNSTFSRQYEENMALFIGDMRSELGVRDLPFVIATTGMAPSPQYTDVERAQIAMGDISKYPEFTNNVRVIDTRTSYLQRPFWYPKEESPDNTGNQGFHWNRNGKTHIHIGLAAGAAMAELLRLRSGP